MQIIQTAVEFAKANSAAVKKASRTACLLKILPYYIKLIHAFQMRAKNPSVTLRVLPPLCKGRIYCSLNSKYFSYLNYSLFTITYSLPAGLIPPVPLCFGIYKIKCFFISAYKVCLSSSGNRTSFFRA